MLKNIDAVTEVIVMHNDIQEILLTEEQIRTRVDELGKILTEEYAGKNPVIVGVLKGVVVFYADMIRKIDTPCQIDFMWISSYKGTQSTGSMVVKQDLSADIEGRHVLILEDIFDTGNSLQFTYDYLMSKNPASLKICTFLDKPARRRDGITVKADYVGYTIPDAFVVGYGLDFNEHYRNLPYLGVLKPEAYEE
jgi:hypoxanthine phosphoribosyltransferase